MRTGHHDTDTAAPGEREQSVLRMTNRIVRGAISLLLVVLFVMTGVLMRMQYQAARKVAETQVHRTAHVVATQYGWMFQAGFQALRRIAELTATHNPEDLEPHDINEALRDLPVGFQHSLYDADGRLILTSVPRPDPISVADREYFTALRDGAAFVISPMITERLTGQKVFILARRTGESRTFGGVATIAIPVPTLAEMAAALDFDGNSTASLVRTDGILLARSPPIEPMDLSDTPLFEHLGQQPSGSYTAVSPADGRERIVGYWKLDDWPVIAVAALSEDAVFREFWDRIRTELAIFLPLVLGLLVTMAWLWRLQARDERRERALVEANSRADFLMKEIHHRVKNNLQTVMSLIRLERLPDEAKAALMGRISAMAALHEEIYSVGVNETIPARRYLVGVIENVMRSHQWTVGLDAEIEDVRLPGDRAMQLGMLVNEVISNAYKHAFRDRRQGCLEVKLGRAGPGELRLCICDDGPGYDPAAVEEHMGSRLIEAFGYQLGGTILRENRGGLCVTLTFPVAPPPAGDDAGSPA